MSATNKWFLSKDKLVLLTLWLIVTAININKAFHIDDTFHLESAEWIEKHPFKPMSGYINWYNNPEEMYHFNQPSLLFYLIALVGKITGYNEPGLHTIIAFFSFLALWYFQKLLHLFQVSKSHLILSIFALCPAFIVNQNLMTDIPILALELGFLYHLLLFDDNRKHHLLYAMLFLGASLLIKYSMIPLIIVAAFALVLKKKYKQLSYLAIPFLFLVLWSVWNKIEYGGIHIKDRPKNEINLKTVTDQMRAMIACLGSVLPISLLLLSGTIKKKIVPVISVLLILAFAGFTYSVYIDKIDEVKASETLNLLFMTIGCTIIIAAIYITILNFKEILVEKTMMPKFNFLVVLMMLAGMSGFLVLYAPFTATRHVLLLLPMLLLILSPLIDRAYQSSALIGLGTTATLGILLSVSDWVYADFYRSTPAIVKARLEGKVWSAGHWGWQWYAEKAGMATYAEDSVKVNEGDYLVYPANISKQDINENLELKEVTKFWKEPDWRTFFSVHRFASLYNSYTYKPAWQFSKSPVDEVRVYEIRFKADSSIRDSAITK